MASKINHNIRRTSYTTLLACEVYVPAQCVFIYLF